MNIFVGNIWNTSEEWSSQFIFQLKQLERRSLKKKSGLQRDSNPWPPWYRCNALPTELWSHTLGVRSIDWVHIFLWGVKWCEVIWNNSYLNCGCVDTIEDWSLQLIFQLKQLERRSLKKNQGFNGIRNRDLRDTVAMLYQHSSVGRAPVSRRSWVRLRVVPLLLSTSCVTARKKWPREILGVRSTRKEGLPPKPKSLPFHGRVIFLV